MTVSILVVSEGSLMREAFVKLLSADPEITVVGEASSGAEALERAQALAPHVVLMDLSMAGMDGVTATRLMKEKVPDVKVILIGASSDEDTIVGAVRAGARGYVSKSSDGTALLTQIKRAASGGVALSEAMTTKLINAIANEQILADISNNGPSAREREVLALICEGATNKGIAATLVVSENTVRAHVRSLMQKLDAGNRTQLAIYALHNGMDGNQGAQAVKPVTVQRPTLYSTLGRRGILSSTLGTALPARRAMA